MFSSKKFYIPQPPEDDKRLHFQYKQSINLLQVQGNEQGLGSLSHSMTELWNTKSSQQVFSSQVSQRVLPKTCHQTVEPLVTGCCLCYNVMGF